MKRVVTKSGIALTLLAGLPVRILQIPAEQTLQLRQSILWPTTTLSQLVLPEDSLGKHYGAFLVNRDNPVAVISLFLENIPIDKGVAVQPAESVQRSVRFRKFACDSQHQGKGLGTQLLRYSLSMARSQDGATHAWCDARTEALGWYERRGLVPFGSEFDKGGVKYIRMKIDLQTFEPST